MKKKEISIGIIGGGILGMTLALRLAEKGLHVTVIEKEEHIGGLASPIKIGNYVWDKFYHVILHSDSHLIDLLNQLNLGNQIRWSETKTGFYSNGNLYSMSNLIEYLAFPPLTLIDKLRLGWTIFYASKIRKWNRLEKILAVDWLQRHSGKRTFEKVWLPLLKSKLGNFHSHASASFIWASISRLYAARRSGLKKEMLGYVDGGYKNILDQFQKALDKIGVKTVYNSPVHKISAANGRVELEAKNGTRFNLDKVILTLPCTQIPNLCPQLTPYEKERLKKVFYQQLICAALILKKSLSNYYITNIVDEWVPFTGVIEMTALVSKDYFGGDSLIYLPKYLSKEDSLWMKHDDDLQELFLSALEKMYPSFKREHFVGSNIARIVDFPIIPTLDYSKEALPETITSLPNVFIVNSAQILNGTININEIVGLANKKAEQLLKYLT